MTLHERFITFLHSGEDFRLSMLMDIHGTAMIFIAFLIIVFFALLFIQREKFNIRLWGRSLFGLGMSAFVGSMLFVMFDSKFAEDYYSCVNDVETLEIRGDQVEVQFTTCRYRIVGTNDWSNKTTVGSKMVVKP